MSRGVATAVGLADFNEVWIPEPAPTVRLVGHAPFGAPPAAPGTGPASVVRLLAAAGLDADDVDVWAANDSFAAVPLGATGDVSELIGATGCISAVKALYELAHLGGRYAVVTVATGRGQGVAALFARE